jgi:hypothetical protein
MKIAAPLTLAVLALAACGSQPQAAKTAPASVATHTIAAPSATPVDGPRLYVASDLVRITPSSAQMAGWQTATRSDLTGPFTTTTNTNPQERPVPAAGVMAGYRQTIGDPGAPGFDTVRTILELFDSPAAARAALPATVRGYEGTGYARVVDASALGLGPETAARSGSNLQLAPQFAQGTVKHGLVVIWRSGNLLLIQIEGGDSGVTIDAAARWVDAVNANAKTQGS